MKKIFGLLGFTFFALAALAQKPQGAPAGFKMNPIGRVYGKIIEAKTKEPVPYASVVVVRSMGKRDSVLGGGLTLDNGDFSIGELPFGPLKLKVSFVGFKDLEQTFVLSPPENVEVDLGNLKLGSDDKVLETVNITAQKSTVQFNLDKKVFNVDKNAVSTGGTAEDVLKTVPSVTVDADGSARLRNQGTTVYVDGRPTPLSINQISADQIEQVEVITNPSAKFEASATGGIINIVLKKNRKPGYNGFVSLGGGFPGRFNGTGNLSVKQGRFNVTAFYNANYINNGVRNYSTQITRPNGVVQDYFIQDGQSLVNNLFQVGRLAVDYTINNRNTLTFGGTATSGRFNFDVNQDFNLSDANRQAVLSGNFDNISRNSFNNYTAQLLWRKTFPKKGEELTADATYNYGGSKNNSDWTTDTVYAGGGGGRNLQQNRGQNLGNQVTFQLDYVNPINDSTKLEAGLRSFVNDRDQNFLANSVATNGTLTFIPTQSTDLRVTDIVNAAYVTYTSRFKGIGYQAGLRFEQSRLDGLSRLDGNQTFGYNYPSSNSNLLNAFFPSLYLSKKFSEKSEFQVNFSRKINRPNFMQIMPFIRDANLKSFSRGNPALLPEFINLAEMNYNKIFGNNNWLISVYLRNEENPITSITRVYDKDPSKLENTFINGLNSTRYGVDNTLKLALGKKTELTTNINAFNTRISAIDNGVTYVNEGWAYTAKANLNVRLPKDFSVQLTGNYESEQILPQGYRLPVYFSDFALKKDLFKVASLTFAVNDIFDTRRRIDVVDTPNLYQESFRRREVRNFRLTFQFRFGKMDASIFKRGKTPQRNQGGSPQEMDF